MDCGASYLTQTFYNMMPRSRVRLPVPSSSATRRISPLPPSGSARGSAKRRPTRARAASLDPDRSVMATVLEELHALRQQFAALEDAQKPNQSQAPLQQTSPVEPPAERIMSATVNNFTTAIQSGEFVSRGLPVHLRTQSGNRSSRMTL